MNYIVWKIGIVAVIPTVIVLNCKFSKNVNPVTIIDYVMLIEKIILRPA